MDSFLGFTWRGLLKHGTNQEKGREENIDLYSRSKSRPEPGDEVSEKSFQEKQERLVEYLIWQNIGSQNNHKEMDSSGSHLQS
jgi:hypothetical protein